MGRRPTTATPAAKLIDRQASARSVLSWQLMTERRDSRCYSRRLAAEAIELGTCHSANCARSGPRQSNFPGWIDPRPCRHVTPVAASQSPGPYASIDHHTAYRSIQSLPGSQVRALRFRVNSLAPRRQPKSRQGVPCRGPAKFGNADIQCRYCKYGMHWSASPSARLRHKIADNSIILQVASVRARLASRFAFCRLYEAFFQVISLDCSSHSLCPCKAL